MPLVAFVAEFELELLQAVAEKVVVLALLLVVFVDRTALAPPEQLPVRVMHLLLQPVPQLPVRVMALLALVLAVVVVLYLYLLPSLQVFYHRLP